MERKLTVGLVALALAVTVVGCGRSMGPAGDAVDGLFNMTGGRSFDKAFKKHAHTSLEITSETMKGWMDKYGTMTGGRVRKVEYFDASDALTTDMSKAVSATVYYDCYEGSVSAANRLVWLIEVEKEKKAGADFWGIHLDTGKTMRRAEMKPFFESLK